MNDSGIGAALFLGMLLGCVIGVIIGFSMESRDIRNEICKIYKRNTSDYLYCNTLDVNTVIKSLENWKENNESEQ